VAKSYIEHSEHVVIRRNKKAELSQRWPRDAPYVCALKNFRSPWQCTRLLFPNF